MDKLIIGTRGSKLSLAQTEIIRKKLAMLFPEKDIEVKIIKTTGDKNMNPIPLDTIGKGWFTKELDNALIDSKIDLAVHSLKDLPEVLPEGLIIAAIPLREDARDALVTREHILFDDLKEGAVIGTDSTRRKSQILHKRPDLIVKSLRGNVITRLEKLDNGEYDGIFLAVAGLKRLGLDTRITQYFEETDFIPSPGQGALAIVIRKDNKILIEQLQKLHHEESGIAVTAERAFSQALGGGCKMPIGAYATIKKNKIILYGIVGSLDGTQIYKDTLHGSISLPERLGKNMADNFIDNGFSWFDKPKFVVITRPQNASIKMQKEIESVGLRTFFYPSISIAKSIPNNKIKNILSDIDSVDWIIFTSQNGIRFFVATLNDQGIPLTKLKNKKIAVVGKKTAEAVRKYGLKVSFVPSQFTTENLADELKDINGKKILMARANLATPLLVEKLQKKGATVIDIPIYKTSFIENDNPEFGDLLENQQIYCINFTSPSIVKGFVNNVKKLRLHKAVLAIPALSIGPVTTKELMKQGFQHIITADVYTINGMITKLKENIL